MVGIISDLIKSLKELRLEVKKKHKRSLPVGELLSDRWERAAELGFAEGVSIYDSAVVFDNVTVGANTWIGPYTILDGSGELKIGSNCSIGTGVQIYSHDTVKWAITGGSAPYEHAPTSIGNNCFIGPNTIIAMGVTIGNNCIVGVNSFVCADVPSGTKVAGSPAKVIGKSEIPDSLS